MPPLPARQRSSTTQRAHPRLHVIFARKADVGIVLRRGPSKWVGVIHWDRATDRFTRGSWFHGRIYERRCDLSPHGDLFVYFAQKLGGRQDGTYTHAWTAVSKPPWLTALALWPKGNCWDGGGLFSSDYEIWVNHSKDGAHPHPDHPPKGLRVTSEDRGRGEDFPIYGFKLERDGWIALSRLRTQLRGSRQGFQTLQPGVWERPSKSGRWKLVMRLSLAGYRQRYDYEVAGPGWVESLPGAEWADWDGDRGLTYAAKGTIYRTTPTRAGLEPSSEIANFVADAPKPRKPPNWATRW